MLSTRIIAAAFGAATLLGTAMSTAPASAAHGGSGFPRTAEKSAPSSNGRITSTATPADAAAGRSRFSASRVATE